jgi:hypothetical protein
MIELVDLLPAAQQGWEVLLELAEDNDTDWLLIGGQMMYLLAIEHGTQLPRPTADMDVVVNVGARPGGTRWLAGWLLDRGFGQDTPSADGISHRFSRSVGVGHGTVIFDVLAPEGLGETTDLTTVPHPAAPSRHPARHKPWNAANWSTWACAEPTATSQSAGYVDRTFSARSYSRPRPSVRSQRASTPIATGRTAPYCSASSTTRSPWPNR